MKTPPDLALEDTYLESLLDTLKALHEARKSLMYLEEAGKKSGNNVALARIDTIKEPFIRAQNELSFL